MAGANGWWESPWFGTFYYTMPNGWLMHQEMGWLFVFPMSNGGGMWFWREEDGYGPIHPSFLIYMISQGNP